MIAFGALLSNLTEALCRLLAGWHALAPGAIAGMACVCFR